MQTSFFLAPLLPCRSLKVCRTDPQRNLTLMSKPCQVPLSCVGVFPGRLLAKKAGLPAMPYWYRLSSCWWKATVASGVGTGGSTDGRNKRRSSERQDAGSKPVSESELSTCVLDSAGRYPGVRTDVSNCGDQCTCFKWVERRGRGNVEGLTNVPPLSWH